MPNQMISIQIEVMPLEVVLHVTSKVNFVNCQSTLINHLIQKDYSMFTYFLL